LCSFGSNSAQPAKPVAAITHAIDLNQPTVLVCSVMTGAVEFDRR
jgi:hypothetical protein